MSDYERKVIDMTSIAQQVAAWGVHRDAQRWEQLRDIWTEDGTIAVTWFRGTADEFIEASRELTTNENKKPFNQHLTCGSVIEINGDHAVSEARGQVIIRLTVDNVMCDLTSQMRFYDLFLRTSGGWKIKQRVAIFDKDSIAPMNYGQELKLDLERLNSFPIAYRHIAYALSQKGVNIVHDLPAPDSPALDLLYGEGAAWLASGKSS